METFIKKLLTKRHHQIPIFAILILLILFGSIFAQSKPAKDECKDKKKSSKKAKPRQKIISAPFTPKPPAPSRRTESFISPVRDWVVRPRGAKTSSEKSLAVASKVLIGFCVSSGKVKINGWNRNEIRAFVDRGTPIGFAVRERTESNEKPTWIDIVGYELKKEGSGRIRNRSLRRSRRLTRVTKASKCLAGKTIELDVPYNASIKLKGTYSETTIDSVRSANVNQLRGSIYLNNVKNGVEAKTYRGNIVVKNSRGKISASTQNGNIIGYKTRQNEIGDYFSAKTNSGSITLQSVRQREVKTSSTSGVTRYVGRTYRGGQYDFSTTRGLIVFAVPANTSCRIRAFYGRSFSSEIPLKDVHKSRAGSSMLLEARIGEGSCQLKFTSAYGRIHIQDLNKRRKTEAAKE